MQNGSRRRNTLTIVSSPKTLNTARMRRPPCAWNTWTESWCVCSVPRNSTFTTNGALASQLYVHGGECCTHVLAACQPCNTLCRSILLGLNQYVYLSATAPVSVTHRPGVDTHRYQVIRYGMCAMMSLRRSARALLFTAIHSEEDQRTRLHRELSVSADASMSALFV